jgi:hypothetical protein
MMSGTSTSRFDQRMLDRLVDGELTREEYAALLRSLEQAPDGWRRCATAFLEAQAWQRELGVLQRETDASKETASTHQATVRPREHYGVWPLLVAVAASFLVAFGLGTFFRSWWAPGGSSTTPIVQESPQPGSPEAVAVIPAPPSSVVRTPEPSGNVTLVVDQGNGAGKVEPWEVDVPVYELSPENAKWLARQHAQIPAEVRRALQRLGHDVRWDQQFVPLEHEDGRQVVVPVERFEITPVGRHRYQ